MEFKEFPKWVESPDSTPEDRKGVIVHSKAEEEALKPKENKPVITPLYRKLNDGHSDHK